MYPVWFVVAFIVALVAFYVFVGGVTYQVMCTALERKCGCYKGYSCYDDHEIGAFFMGLLWPLGIPAAAGILGANKAAHYIIDKKELT